MHRVGNAKLHLRLLDVTAHRFLSESEMSGDFSDALQGSSQVLETINILKKHTG
jgi:hypothetical protein